MLAELWNLLHSLRLIVILLILLYSGSYSTAIHVGTATMSGRIFMTRKGMTRNVSIVGSCLNPEDSLNKGLLVITGCVARTRNAQSGGLELTGKIFRQLLRKPNVVTIVAILV